MYFNCFGNYRPDFQLVWVHVNLSNESTIAIYTWWECVPVYEVPALYCLTTDLWLIHNRWKNESGISWYQYYLNICNAIGKIQWAGLGQLWLFCRVAQTLKHMKMNVYQTCFLPVVKQTSVILTSQIKPELLKVKSLLSQKATMCLVSGCNYRIDF